MNSQRHIQALRVQLLAMSRLSQRALDYSVKGYEFRNLDFARQVGAADGDIEDHHRRIKELCREAVNGGITNASDFRFAFAALNIAAALHVTYSAAAQMAQGTIDVLNSGGIEESAALKRMGRAVNASMRLCIVALFERDACHAQAVLRNDKEAFRLFELRAAHSRRADPQQSFERTVIEALGEVAKQVHEMGSALLFWLEGNRMSPAVSMPDVSSLSRQVASARQGDTTLHIREALRQKPLQGFSC
jgi:PhoU domain